MVVNWFSNPFYNNFPILSPQKTSETSFLMFSEGVEMEQQPEMGQSQMMNHVISPIFSEYSIPNSDQRTKALQLKSINELPGCCFSLVPPRFNIVTLKYMLQGKYWKKLSRQQLFSVETLLFLVPSNPLLFEIHKHNFTQIQLIIYQYYYK